ncbi:uncharacterized protein [Coffea arabica]|uniref:SWIM-type domain-containing protein n=1 Tax=Coffea arabica TaxID=13443 RepID=A0A6P6TEJ6_COFAR|nr:uncharacterized protein LOC113700627 [Coffea arabica]
MDMNDPKFHVGQQFDDKQLFKMAVDNYAVKWGKDIKWVKHDKHRMRVKCKAEHCKWMLFASKIDEGDDSIAIKTMGPAHTCGRTFYHKRAISGFLARKYVDFLRMNKRITVSEFKDKVHAELNVNITKPQVYKTFMKAKILIHGSYKDQYNRLWDYCEELMKANPGSTVYMETTLDKDSGKQRFQKLYICFETLKRGFKSGCRKIIGVDGCHLRGPHPVAYAVVEAENKRSWKWFIEFLKYDLSINDQRNWSFISDRQKGLGSSIQEVIPNVEHRHCVRHLHNNFKKNHPGEALKERFWTCARSSYMRMFENHMECLRDYDVATWKWLNDNTSPYHWSISHFRVAVKCDILLNNLCESFNSIIMDAREKPILGMFETIRIYLMERLRTKREWMKKMSDKICPKIQKKLEKAKTEVAANIARWSDQDKFEVTHMYGGKHVVDLKQQTCSCRRWELTGLPCCHVICCISLIGQEPESLVHHYYSRDSYLKAYEPAIAPLSGPNVWVQSDKDPVLPPLKLKLPGRPKKVRRREPEEPRPNSKGVTKLSRSGLVRMTYQVFGKEPAEVPLESSSMPDVPSGDKAQAVIDEQEVIDLQPSGQEELPEVQKKFTKCSFCHGLGHNRQTCATWQAQAWRKRKAAMTVFGPFPPSKGKMIRKKEKAHRLLDEEDDIVAQSS